MGSHLGHDTFRDPEAVRDLPKVSRSDTQTAGPDGAGVRGHTAMGVTMQDSAYRPPKGTPFGDAYNKAELDLRDEATDEELDWLEDNPLMWLRALSRLETHYQARTGMDKMSLKRLAPLPGEVPSREYLAGVKELKRKQQYRMHLLEVIATRREEVKSMVDDESIITLMTVGDLLEMMLQLREYAQHDDFEHIESSVSGVIKMIEKRTQERDREA